MRTRRHHNNTGLRQIQRGRTVEQVQRIARRLGVPYDDCEHLWRFVKYSSDQAESLFRCFRCGKEHIQ